MAEKSSSASSQQLAREILVYLTSHPHAADTQVGITEWWLSRGGRPTADCNVNDALEVLLREGLIETATQRGNAVYRAKRR